MIVHIKPAHRDLLSITATNLGGGWKDRDYGRIPTRKAVENMELIHDLHPGECELTLSSGGFSVQIEVIEKAIELVGLDEIQAAKQKQANKIIF